MASQPEEMPAFGSDLFGPERVYNGEMLQRAVVWPLVNHLWVGGNDWLAESENGFRLAQPFRGRHNGSDMHIQIMAECCELEVNDQLDDVRNASIQIEQEVPEIGKSFVLQAARIALAEGIEKQKDAGEEDVPDFNAYWPNEPDADLRVINGIAYRFSTHFNSQIRYYRKVTGNGDHNLQVPYSQAELDHMDTATFRLPDIENFEAINHVIRAPKLIQRALEEVRVCSIEII